MTADELIRQARETGIVLEPRLHVRAPRGTVSSELRHALAAHRDEILAQLLTGDEGPVAARRLHGLYHAACFKLAETLGWPRLKLDPPATVARGEAMWRLYLTKASVPELREQVLPKLQGMIATIPPPDDRATP